MIVTNYFQVYHAYLQWSMAASGPRLKDPVPLADQPGDDCSNEECSDKEEIPCLLAEQVSGQSQLQAAPSGTRASTSMASVSAKHPCPEP